MTVLLLEIGDEELKLGIDTSDFTQAVTNRARAIQQSYGGVVTIKTVFYEGLDVAHLAVIRSSSSTKLFNALVINNFPMLPGEAQYLAITFEHGDIYQVGLAEVWEGAVLFLADSLKQKTLGYNEPSPGLWWFFRKPHIESVVDGVVFYVDLT